MRLIRSIFGSRRLVQFALAGTAAVSLAACADSDRFVSNPLGNPYATASIRPRPPSNDQPPSGYHPPAPSPIFSQPLPAPEQTGSLPERHVGPQYAHYEAPAHESPKLAEPIVPMHPETTTASIGSSHGGWSPQGGMPVIAAQGETARILGERYNVPPDVLLHVNGMNSSSQIHAGTRLIVPVYSANTTARTAEFAKPEAHPPMHEMTAREKRLSMQKPALVHAAKAPEPEPKKMARATKAEQVKTAEALKKAEAAKKTEVAEKTAPAARIDAPKPQKIAKIEEPAPKKPAPAVDPTPTASVPPAAPVSASGNPEFRWPARGRIIQCFKCGGNDGINIAVPEGTSVKAAESGVVAYAGSEIKGFGNLVLIRHPNGYVSAYANNGELDVKRGEQVKRGQVIAKSGQSGNVASPQLHFELRKGSTPVDPTQFLAGGA